jgi:hypothetical protein
MAFIESTRLVPEMEAALHRALAHQVQGVCTIAADVLSILLSELEALRTETVQQNIGPYSYREELNGAAEQFYFATFEEMILFRIAQTSNDHEALRLRKILNERSPKMAHKPLVADEPHNAH